MTNFDGLRSARASPPPPPTLCDTVSTDYDSVYFPVAIFHSSHLPKQFSAVNSAFVTVILSIPCDFK